RSFNDGSGKSPLSGSIVVGSLRLNRTSSFWRTLTASAAIAAAVILTGCQTDGVDFAKAMKPLSPQMVALIGQMGMTKASPTGAHLMVHVDCSSRGCYAMTDDQISEIYSLARESFFGGQKAFQIQAYPFRMTPLNMAKHRNNPHFAFWKMLKQGSDHFEASRL